MNQLDKNTVSAKGQLKESEFVTLPLGNAGGSRVLFVGNSITKHGLAPHIGWNRVCGMAASDPEKDYVHSVMRRYREQGKTATACICQVAEWERNYQNPTPVLPLYAAARDFDADLLIFRAVENCSSKDFHAEAFEKALRELLAFLNPEGKAKVVLTTGFWKHPGDETIVRLAEEFGYPCVNLGDLGEDDRMKAVGLFEHSGVANHPGDAGMEAIADRIWNVIGKM